jgi:SAM-dependent methyltransferase
MVKFEMGKGMEGAMANQQDWSASFTSASTSAMSFYDEIMVPRMFAPFAELLLDQLAVHSGQAVLDVACGPGTVTRPAALRVGPMGRVTGCDLSPAMLELARSKDLDDASAPIDYLKCPADSLEVPDDTLDAVTCQQGLQFFPDRPAALEEMRRVLRPGGQLGIAVWCAIEDCPPFLALATALGQVLGSETANAYRNGPWGFPDSAPLVRLVTDAGFADVSVQRCELPIAFEGGPDQLMLTLRAASVAETLSELSEADRLALASAIEKASRPITFDGIVRSHMTTNILTASVGD